MQPRQQGSSKNTKGDLRDAKGDEMDPKLFMLIGTIISLSHLGDENLAKIKSRLRNIVSVFLLSLTSASKT
ncbi:MAG: hypothetical protein ABSF41_17605 [Pseudolabrys sp.]|jgi:hypothetical protein